MVTSSGMQSDRSQIRQTRAVTKTTSSSPRETVDRRLTSGRIPNVTVHVNRSGRRVALCAVRAIGSHEIVLIAPQTERSLALGDQVTVSVYEGDRQVFAEQSAVVHWSTTEGDLRIVALFTGGRLDRHLEHLMIDDRRKDIRYPVSLQAFIKVDGRQRCARIVNYSLNGLFLVSHAVLEVDRDYHATVNCDDGHSFCLSLAPKWTTITAEGNRTGCLLEPQRGVLFARRYAAKAVAPDKVRHPASCSECREDAATASPEPDTKRLLSFFRSSPTPATLQ